MKKELLKEKREDIPSWSNNVLQGLAFFIGYKSKLYWNHDIMEGTIADELCILFNANFSKGERAFREVMYKKILQNKYKDSKRTDIVITCDFKGKKEELLLNDITQIIEIKRYKKIVKNKASNNQKTKKITKKIDPQIEKDMNRILEALKANKRRKNSFRGFVIVVSQCIKPEEFVNGEGKAKRKHFKLDGGYALVRRVCKAASSFKNIENANYACLIEVFTN